MWNPNSGPATSFFQPVAIPTPGSQDAPLICLQINASWLPYVLGGLMQLVNPATWDTTDPTALQDILQRVMDLIGIWGSAGVCMQAGTQPVTIASGSAVGSAAVTFPTAFSTAPVVVVSDASGLYIASAASVTASGFTAGLTAFETVDADSTDTVSWIARLAP